MRFLATGPFCLALLAGVWVATSSPARARADAGDPRWDAHWTVSGDGWTPDGGGMAADPADEPGPEDQPTCDSSSRCDEVPLGNTVRYRSLLSFETLPAAVVPSPPRAPLPSPRPPTRIGGSCAGFPAGLFRPPGS